MLLEAIVEDIPNSKYMKTIDQKTKDGFYQPGDKVKIKTGKDKGQIAVFVKYSDNHEGWATLILDGEKIERNINEITKDKQTADEDIIKITKENNGYDISVFIDGKKEKTAWANDATDAMRKAKICQDYYKDENGQPVSIKQYGF